MDMTKVLNLPPNSDWILFNTMYHKNIDKTDRRSPDAITLVLKNTNSGKKMVKTITDPNIEIYMAKEHIDLGYYNHVDIPIDNLDVYDVNYKNKLRDMAKLIDKEDFYWNCIKQKRFSDLDQLLTYNRFFSADRNIEDFYMYKCRKHFGDKELNNTTKAFFDIEADIMKGYLDLKHSEGDAPINIVSIVFDETKTVYTIALRDSDNPLIAEFEKDFETNIGEIADELNEEYDVNFSYKSIFVDTEVELITLLFQLINAMKPDFAVCWNMAFDFQYCMYRLKANGVNPADVMCHPDFDVKECYFVKDIRNFEIKKKTDWCRCSSYTVFLDQMINYAAIRKSESKIDSYKLDFIGEREVNINKVDYSEIGHIKYLPYKNYRKFYKYNIGDVMVQYKIEMKTKDLDDVFYRAYSSNTRFSKVFKEITFLTNVAFHDFEEMGLILGNNVNAIKYQGLENVNILFPDDVDPDADDDEETVNKDEKFEGAIVGDPKLIMDVGLRMLGLKQSSTLFDNMVDFDYTSLYPSIIRLFNIYKATIIGQLVLDKSSITKRELRNVDDKYNRGAKYLDDLELNEALHFCHRWLNLPNSLNVLRYFYEYLGDKSIKKIKVKRTSEKYDKNKGLKTIKVKRII